MGFGRLSSFVGQACNVVKHDKDAMSIFCLTHFPAGPLGSNEPTFNLATRDLGSRRLYLGRSPESGMVSTLIILWFSKLVASD